MTDAIDLIRERGLVQKGDPIVILSGTSITK